MPSTPKAILLTLRPRAGLLTATPCSAVPGLQVLDNVTEEWVDAESAATCGVISRGP